MGDVMPGIGGKQWGNHVEPTQTFPFADRFPVKAKAVSQSPNNEYYYSHCKILDASEYAKTSRSASLGGGKKTDFSALSEGGNHPKIGPGSYEICASANKASSALDGGGLRPCYRRRR